MKKKNINKGKIVIYKPKSGDIELRIKLENETVWLTQKQMATLFNKGIPTVNEHIKNIYKEKEVDSNSTIRKFRIVQTEGERQVKRDIEFYNLDVIISVGYRVNSKRGTQFRIWATTILKNHLLDGFTVNEKRLQEQDTKIKELQEKVTLLSRIKSIESVSEEARGIIELMQEFSQALNILDDYDHQKLEIPSGTKKLTYKLTYKKANILVEQMRKPLKEFPLFGKEKDEGFKSSLGALYQTIGKKDVYPGVEEKAAHLLYFVVKNHSFVDGNKRIASTLFAYFLKRNGLLTCKNGLNRINNGTLAALTLMIAVSNPLEKDTMIKVILNLLDLSP